MTELEENIVDTVTTETIVDTVTTETIEPVYHVTKHDGVTEHDCVDKTGYNYDLILTYKMIEDADDQDTLFRLQFLQAFGITTNEYQPEVVSAEMDILYERFHDNEDIREIIQSHPLYNCDKRGGDGEADIVIRMDNSEMIFCMMFSFQVFDLFHKCIQSIHHNLAVPREIKNEIIELYRQMF
jgi:hypothetical protein